MGYRADSEDDTWQRVGLRKPFSFRLLHFIRIAQREPLVLEEMGLACGKDGEPRVVAYFVDRPAGTFSPVVPENGSKLSALHVAKLARGEPLADWTPFAALELRLTGTPNELDKLRTHFRPLRFMVVRTETGEPVPTKDAQGVERYRASAFDSKRHLNQWLKRNG